MNSSVLSSAADLDLEYRKFIWSWIHRHSDDPGRFAVMIGSYYDESSVDGSGPIAAVGGVLMLHRDATWLEIEWFKILLRFPWLLRSDSGKPYLHMKDFGQHEPLGHIHIDERRKLFAELTPLINQAKYYSIGASLRPDEYRDYSKRIPKRSKLTIHTVCFILAATAQAAILRSAKYDANVPFVLDNGIAEREHDALTLAHRFITRKIPDWQPAPGHNYKAGGLDWEDDKEFPWLQVADVVAWAVRRDKSGSPFENGGYEPLREILNVKHKPAHIESDWIADMKSNRGKIQAQ